MMSWTGDTRLPQAFIRMMEKGILFLARLKSSDYKKEQAVMAALGHVTLRMVKVPLPDNKEKYLSQICRPKSLTT